MLNKNRKNKSNQTTLKLRAKKLSVKSIAMLALSFVMAISFSLGISTLYIAPQKVASAGLAEADTPTATYDLTGVSAFGSGATSLKGTGINDTLVVNGTTFYLSGWNSNTEMKFSNGLYLKNRSAIVFDVPYKFDIRISFSHTSGRNMSFGITKNTGDAIYYGSSDSWAKNATFGWSNSKTNNSTPITLEDQVAGTYMLSHVHTTSEITITKIEIWNVDSSTPSTYSVTYDGNGKTGGSVPTDGTSYENNGSVTVLGNTGSLVKTGYTFAGWNTKSDGSGTNYVAGDTFTISANTTLYAKWTANTYSIKFNANGGTGSMDNLAMTYGVAKNLTSNGFEHATLNFAGWATSENGEVVYSDGQSVENLTATQGETVNLYAVWANTITASWVKGDGDWTISDNYAAEVYTTNMHNVTTDVILANSNGIKITAKAGKTAYNDLTTDGANRVPALQNAATNAIEIILPEGFNGTITVQASAYSSSSRSISIAGQQQTFSSGLGSPSTLTVDVATGGTVYIDNLTADKTVYIHSITVTGTADEVVDPITYGVTYADGVNDEVITVPTDGNSYVEGATVTISSTVPSRDGYTFNGWTSSAFNGTKQAGATFTMPASAVTLTATWTENAVEVIKTINSVVAPTGDYSCYQNADVSTAGLPNTVVGNWTGSDGSSGTVNVPVEWSLNTSTTGTKTASGTLGAVSGYVLGVSTVSASVTVNALPANTVTLTFKNGSSTYTTLEVAEGSKPTRPADPTNNDALWFGGWWTKDGSSWGSNETYRSGLSAWGYVFDFDAELTEDTTVYALWIDPVDIVSFQAYIDNMVQNGIVDPYSKPMWGSEGFKGKWNYIDGVFLNSVVNLYYNTDENVTYTYTNWAGNTVTTSKKEFYLNFFTNFVSDYVNDDGEFLTVKSGSGPTSSTTSSTTLDFICESKILYDAYILTGEEKYIKAIENSKEILDKINKVNGSEITIDGVQYYNYSHQNGNGCSNEIWLDGMYMYAPFLTRYLKATNAESSDYQQLLAQYSFILQKMRDSETGLYYHGYAGTGNSDGYWENGGDACSPTFWSRSMGWFVTSLIDVIEYMPNDVPVADGIKARIPANFSTAYGNTIDTSNGKAFLQSMLKDAIDALLAHQDPNSKMFYQVIDGGITVDGYQNYLESSGSSMFAYTIMKAARLFLTGNSADGKSYAVRGQEVFEGIYNHSLNGTNLYDICKMADITDNGATTAYYLNNTDTQITSNDGKGSGPFVMAFVEYNALKNSVTPTAPTTPNINNRRVHVYNNSGFVETLEVVKGSTVSSIEAPAVSGYTFNGWYSDSNLTSSVSGSTVISEDTILYAKYTNDSATYYTVTFMSDGAEYLSTEIEENSTVNRPNDPTKSGYTFGGWFTEEACENEFNFATQITADTTLYAKWTEITGFIWDATEADASDGKVYSFSNGVFVFGTSGTLLKTTTNAGELDGKSLIYASPNSSCRTLTLDIDQEYNVVLYVYVDTTSSRTITIGGVSNTVDLAADNEKGYYKYTGTVSQSKNTVVLSGSGIYWSRVELIKTGSTPTTYTVSFNSNGGSGSMSSQTFTAEVQQAIKENTFTRSGYTFAGWATSSNGSKVYNDTEVITVESNLTLYALWEESATKYTVTFDLNGGNIGGETEYSIEVSSGGYAVKPTNPEKTGSTFMGWYTTEDKSKNKDEFDFDEEAITANRTLYALWFESVDENAMISYIQGLMDGTDLTTMDQGEWNTETWRGYFNYVNGIFINSLVNLSYNTSDEAQKAEYEQFVVDYLERYIRQDGTIVQYASQTATPDPENASEFGNIVRIDFIQTVRTLFDAYEFSGDERFLKAVEYALDKFASAAKVEGTYNNPPHTPSDLNEIWLDGLYMYAPLYARYIAAGGKNSNYTALELFNQYTVVVDNMRDSETGLYYHGYAVDKDTSASPWADPETGLSASFWSRSVGWLAMSLVDVLDYYPSGVSINKSFNGNNYTDARAYLTAVFKDLMDSLLAYQDPDSKMFYQILNHDSIISDVSNDNYLETSGSAMFAYALMKGGKAGYLTGNFTTTAGESLSYNNIGRQIFEGVYAHSVSVSGSTVNVYDICGATSLSDADSDSMATYIGNDIVSNESKGTAPLILAFIEYFNEIVNAPVTPNVNERKIYIETNGGSHNLGVDYIVANINGTLSSSQLPELTKADYEFTGWYLDSALTIPLTFDSTILTEENTTLYAGWSLSDDADVYEITLDGNDGTFGGDQASITATVSQTNPELISSHVPSRSGYEFAGFENSSGTLYFNADGSLCDGVVLSGGETLYAVWKQLVSIKLDFSSFIDASGQATNNNGYNTLFTFKDGTTTGITDTAGHYYYEFSSNTTDGFYAPIGERLNYVLVAWVDQEGNEYAPDTLVIPSKDLTLTPLFQVDPDAIGSRVSVSGSTITWSAYEMSNGKYPESDTNKLYQNIRWTDLYADYKVGDEFTIVSNDLVTVKVDASQLTTYGTDNGHRATTEPMIMMQSKMSTSISPIEITINGSDVTADITVYGFFYKSGRTATLEVYNGESRVTTATTGEGGYGGANTITNTALAGKTPAQATLTGLESGNTYSLIGTGSYNFYISTIVIELNDAPEFTVTFEENGGSTVSDVEGIAVGGKVSSPTAPTRAGYAFDGWYLDSNLTKAYSFNSVVTNDTTLYAKWTATGETPTYSATFNVNYPDGVSSGVSGMPENVVGSAETSVVPSSPSLYGYTFLGWSENEGATSATYAPGATIDITSNPVLYAVWEPITITVTLNAGSGAFSDSSTEKVIEIAYGSSDDLTSEYIPSLSGYNFGGWEQDGSAVYDENGNFVYSAGYWNFTSNKTLTAVWTEIPTYSATFNVNYPDGVSSGVSGMPQNVVDSVSESVVPSSPSLDGYIFLGWSENEGATSATYAPGATIDITSNPVLYAIWAEEGAGNTVNVNYDFSELKDSNTSYNLNNSGNIVVDGTTFTGNNNSHIYTKEATNGILLTSSQVVRKNYALVGWATSQFGEQVYQAGGTYVGNEAEITLYPVWEITGNTDNRTTSTVNGQLETHVWSSYVVNDAYDANNASSYYYMGSENDEYKNIRWTDLYKNNVTNGIYTISGGDSDNYAIKVDTNSGASVDADHRMVSEPLIKIDKKSNSTTYSPIEIVVAEGFTARIKVYAVVYNKAGEISILASDKSTVISSSEVANKYGNTEFTENSVHELVNDFVGGITPNEVSASGLEAGSYYISNTSANHIYITGIEIALAPTSNEYNVNFYNNESETDETVFETVLTFGGTLVLPNTQPTRNGYTFNGWFTQRSGGEKLAEGDVINQETNLYAQWTANIYVVTFVADYPGDLTEGIENIPEQYNSLGVSSFVPDSIPTLTGYYFLGWATTENAESPVYARGTTIGVEGSMTLYTVWASEAVIVYDFSSLNLVTNKNANGNITIDGNNLTDQKWTVTTYIGANHTLLAQQNVSRSNYTITNWTTDGNEYLPGATFTATGSTHTFVPTFVPTNKNEIVAGNLVSSGTTTTWSTYVINGSGVATSAANATRWNIRWTDLYSAQNNAYTFIDNDYATFSANSSLVSVNADHLGTSEPMLASTSSESNRPYTFVVKPGYTATITVYAVVYSGSTTLTFYNGEGVAVSEGSTISASFGGSNTFPTNGVTPSVATVVDLEEGTYTLGNNGSEVYVLGVKVEASLRDDAVIHTVNFNTNGGSDVESKHVLNGNALEAPSAPTKPGFNFVGWFDQSLENEYEFPYTISNEVAQTITMYAKWQAIYTLTFNENLPAGATGSVGDMPANVTNNTTGSVVLAGEPTLSGYNFLGWDTVSNVASPTYKVGDEVDITSNPVLYAIWKKQATGVATGVDLFYNGAWGNGSTNKNVTDANVSNVLVTSVGMSSITLYPGSSGHMLDGVATDMNVLKTGGSTSASRYIKFTVPSSLYSSFKVALIASPNGDGTAVNMWLADSASKTVGSNTVIYTTSTLSKEYITGTISDSYPTMDENGDVTYFLNFSASSRIYRISLELTPVSQEGVERTISYQTDDESRPFAEAIEDGVVESGSPYTIPSTIPTTTNASYVFSHWEDEGGTRYNPGYEFSEVNADITLIAKWDMLITSITWIQPDNRQEISQANSEGVGLPSFATAVSVQNTTLPITWQVNGTNVDSYTFTSVGTYTFNATFTSKTAPEGYAFTDSVQTMVNAGLTYEIEIYELSDNEVTAGAGYVSNGVDDWTTGLTANDGIYTLDTNGQVVITANSNYIADSSAQGYIVLSQQTYEQASAVSKSAIKIDIPANSTYFKLVVGAVKSTSSSVKIINANGEVLTTTTTAGATYNHIVYTFTRTVDGNEAGVESYYVFAEGVATLYSVVANAQYSVGEEEIDTYNLIYWNNVDSNNNYSSNASDPYKYIDGAKVVVRNVVTSAPDHKIFDGWKNKGYANNLFVGNVIEVNQASIQEDSVNLYVQVVDEQKIAITFDLNPPVGMTDDEKLIAFGSTETTKVYEIYSGESLAENSFAAPTYEMIVANSQNWEFVEWQVNGVSYPVDSNTIFDSAITLKAVWNTEAIIDVIVTDGARSVVNGTQLSNVIANLPTELVVVNVDGSATNKAYENASVLSWQVAENNVYNPTPDEATTFVFRGTLSEAPSGTKWYETWANYSYGGYEYERNNGEGEYYVYVLITVEKADSFNSYVAEFTAFSYTGSGENILYNNKSNTHDKAWTNVYNSEGELTTEGLYNEPSDIYNSNGDLLNGVTVARNGEIRVVADNKTVVGKNTPALVDLDYHGQTWSMIKGQNNTDVPFIYVAIPSGVSSVKITVSGVKFRESGRDVDLNIAPLSSVSTTATMTVSAHSYTETDAGSDYNYFYEFTPTTYTYEYTGAETIFAISHVSTHSTNVYITGVRVECSVANQTEHKITYHANDGSSSPKTRQVTYFENNQDTPTESSDDAIIEKNFFERPNYEFVGWSMREGAVTADANYAVGNSIELDGPITLYAVWKLCLKITYHANDGTGDFFDTYYVNGRGPISECLLDMADRTGIFLYWNTKEDGSGTQYYPGDIWTDGEKVGQIAKNENLYAIWGEGEVYEANYFGYSYVTVDGIDRQFTNTSQTFGISWTSKYTDSVIARNGGITATVIDAITPTAGYRSAPLILLDQNAKIQVSVPYSGHVTITIHARYSGKSENVSIGGNDYQITKTFNDSQTFAPYVADKLIHTQAVSGTNDSPDVIDVVNELSGTIVISSLEISVATADNVTSRTITYTNGIEGEGAESVTYKLIDSVELTDGSVVNYSTDGVVGVNNFINNGYKFANWTVNDSQTTVNYGDTISADADITYTANWIAETYKYQLWVDEDIDDHSAQFVKKNGEVEFTFGQEVVLGELEKSGYTFNGWFAEQECYTLVSAENGNNPFTFEMIDENGVVNVYAYFTNNNVEKTILTASTLESKSIYILDLLDDVYADQGSNSDSTVITAKGLKLPENVVVADENSATFSKNIDITWLTKGYTVGQLRFADNERTYTVEGFVKLSDEDFELYSFADNQQQAHVTIEVTIKNLVIYFTNDEPLIEKNIVVPLNTPKSTVISYLAVSGYYTDLDGIQATYAPSGLVWECAAYNPNNAQNYIFESDLVADIGYTFCTNSTEKTYAREIHALANVEVQDTSAKAGLGGVGFVRENASDWTGGVTGDFVLDVHDGLALTGIGGRFDCVNGYLKINNNVSAVEIDVPAGVRKLAIYYVANNERTGQQLLSLVDAQGNALASSSAGIVIDATTYGASITYESNEDIGTVYIKGASSAAYLSKLLVLADSLSVMSDKLVTIKYTYGGTTVYEKQILNAASVEDGENDYTAFAKGAKFALPTYATAFGTEVEGTNIEFLGWSTYPGASAPQYKAQDFIDVETDIQLYAVVGRKTINLTFNTGFGKSYTVAVPYGESTNSSNFIVYGANREQELIELENSRIGYKFVEWKMEGGGSFNPDGKLTEDNIQLFADWTERTYTIKFADESGVLNNLTLEGVSYKDLISEPTAENCPIKDNYSFRAWTYTIGEDVYDWNFFAFTLENRGVITSNSVTEFTLTASFGVKIQFVSEYDSIIGSAEPVVEDNTVYPVGYEYDLTKKVTGLHGYNFVGWSLVKNDVEKIDSVILNQNTTVYAVWTKKEITIRFVTGDNEIEFAPFEEIKYYGDTDLEEPNVSATGYVVYNWTYVDQEGKTRVWVFGGDNPTTVFLPTDEHGNDSPVITLYAQWGVNVNFVAYDTINGEEINVNPWYNQVKVSIGGTIPFINVTGSPDGSSTIHAKPVIPGYTFDRWAKGIDVNADSIDSSFVLTKENLASIGYDQASKAVTVYAIFTRNAEGMKYTVTFEDAYNTGVELPEAIEVDATVGQFTFVSSLIPQVDSSKADYIRFVGWTDNRDGSGTKYALNDVYNIGSNTTLYAFWEITINKVDKETSGADVTISEVETLQNNLINTFGGSYCDPSSKEVVHSFDNVFDAIWYLNEARFGSTSGEVVDLTAGAYGLDVGLYYVPVKLQLPTDSVFVWDNSVEGLMLEQDDQGRIWASVEILSSNYLIVEVLPITETVKYNTNYVLTTVVANLSNGSKVNLKANWNSQIDTTLLGVHYVEGEVLTGNFQFSADCVNRTAKATITITDKNGVTDTNVYKIYQPTTLPNVENLNDFEFICWTDNGTNAFNGGDVAGAGAYTKVFAKLSVQSTASIRDKELLGYGGLRFTAELEFSSSKYVGQLLYSKDNKAGVIQLSMTFTGDGETIGSGAPFMNIVSTNSNTKFIFSGVLSDLPDAYLATEFTPTAILSVVRNGVAIYTTSETGPSASYNGTIS